MKKSSQTSEEAMKEQLEGEKLKNHALEEEIESMKELIKKLQEHQQEGKNESVQGDEIVGNKASIIHHSEVEVGSELNGNDEVVSTHSEACLLYTSPSPRDS